MQRFLRLASFAMAIIFFISLTIMFFVNATSDLESDQFADLENRCGLDQCCLRSVERMRSGGYQPAQASCPEGFSMNMLRCATSYEWCAPTRTP